MRVLGYARVSTNEQAASGAGLSVQEASIRAACESRGYELADFVADEGFSAKDLCRPGIEGALLRLKNGEVDGLMVAKLDRLSRSVLDFATLVERARKEGWALICLDLGVDTSTAAGEVMANVLAAFAQFERRLISERTKAALAVKKAEGVIIGRPRVTPAWVHAEAVHMRRAGLSYGVIAQHFMDDEVPTSHGGQMWHRSTVKALCSRV